MNMFFVHDTMKAERGEGKFICILRMEQQDHDMN